MTRLYASIDPSAARSIGAHGHDRSGPILIVTAGMHGNEPAGVYALRRVFAELERVRPTIAGRVVGLLGNRAALARDVRFVDRDLNRMWSRAEMQKLGAADRSAEPHERAEQRELVAAIESELAREHAGAYLLDLHSTSAEGPPFTVLDDEARNHKLAAELGVPAILGLLRELEGTILDYAGMLQVPCVVFEAGQNQAPGTIEHHEAAIWITLAAAGLIEEGPRVRRARERLVGTTGGLPGAVEVCLRYAIEPGEQFTMLPGFRSFQRVDEGELLALGGKHGRREIRAPMGAILLMPRYQGQGLDGFFLAHKTDLVA